VPYGRTRRALDRELAVHRWVRFILNRFRREDYDELLDLLDGPTQRHLSTHTRDELAQTLLKLLVTQPRFLRFAPRLLMPRSRPAYATFDHVRDESWWARRVSTLPER
jgi:hypothetical protein